MPSNRDIREQRRTAIREILMGEQPVSQQKELMQLLQKRGIPATQSSVSRDLAEIGAVRIGERWRLPDWVVGSPFSQVLNYVREVKPAGPHMTLINTSPGSGVIVARAIEASQWDDVVGTMAGLDSVLVLTADALDQRLLLLRIERYMTELELDFRENELLGLEMEDFDDEI